MVMQVMLTIHNTPSVSVTSGSLSCSSGRDRGEKTVSGRHGLSWPGEEIHQHHQHRDIPGNKRASQC